MKVRSILMKKNGSLYVEQNEKINKIERDEQHKQWKSIKY